MLRDEGEIGIKHNFVFNIYKSSVAGQTALASLAQINVVLPGEGGGGVANTNIYMAARQSPF